MKDDDRFIVEIPGLSVLRIRDNRVEKFMAADGVTYHNMEIEHVVELEALFAKVADELSKLAEKSGKGKSKG